MSAEQYDWLEHRRCRQYVRSCRPTVGMDLIFRESVAINFGISTDYIVSAKSNFEKLGLPACLPGL